MQMHESPLLPVAGALFPPLQAGDYLELRALHQETGEVVREFHARVDTLLRRAQWLTKRGYHVWYGINPRKSRAGGDANCTRAHALPADIDAKLWGGDLAAASAAVGSFPLRPSANVCSGGGYQPRWFLETPLNLQDPTDVRRYRLVATRLARALCGADRTPDTVSNPERILRVPDTLNWKPEYATPRPVTVEWCDTALRYDITTIEAWLDEHAGWTGIAPPAPARPTTAPLPASGVIGDFNARYDPLPLLVQHGARIAHAHGNVTHLTRPGKQSGTSATYNYYPDTLIVFSEEWPPFAAHRPGGGRRGYDPFAIFTLLEHGGDGSAAYRAAERLGYGLQDNVYGIPVASMTVRQAVSMLKHGGCR